MHLFHKISKIEHNKLILFLILIISVDYEKSIFLCVMVMIVSFLSLQIKNYIEPLEILKFSKWTFVKIS